MDDEALQGDLDSPRPKDLLWGTSPAPQLMDTETNGTSLNRKHDALVIRSPTKSDAGPPPAISEDLCEVCRKINFDALKEVDFDYGYSLSEKKDPLWSLGPQPYRELEASARFCKLCRFFSQFFAEILDVPWFEGDLDPIMISLHNDESTSASWSFSL
jgi:hypothetical protein